MHSWKKNKTYFFMLAFNKSLLLFSLLLPFRSLPSMLLSLFARSLVSVTTSRTSASHIKFSSLETSRVDCNPFCRPLHFHRRSKARLGAVPWCSPTSDSSVTRNHTALSCTLQHTFRCTHWHFLRNCDTTVPLLAHCHTFCLLLYKDVCNLLLNSSVFLHQNSKGKHCSCSTVCFVFFWHVTVLQLINALFSPLYSESWESPIYSHHQKRVRFFKFSWSNLRHSTLHNWLYNDNKSA